MDHSNEPTFSNMFRLKVKKKRRRKKNKPHIIIKRGILFDIYF